jgi:transcription elongation factor greA
MDNKKFYELTEEGRLNLEREKQHLIDVDRPNNIKALQDARSQGDLSENADYDAAREEQSRIEARIAEITEILKNVKIITKDSSNRVTTGKNVTIEFIGMNKTESYDIVGTIEADPFEHKISNESPLGKAIMGHDKGTTLTVVTEKGKEFRVKIIDVK